MSVPNYDPPPRKSGVGWLTVFMVVLLLIVLSCAGLCGGCYMVGRNVSRRASKSFEEGLEYIQLMPAFVATQQAVLANPQVIDRLGEPISIPAMPTRKTQGKLNPKGETFQFDISGPKGTAIVSGVATKEGEQFRAQTITVTFADNSVVTIDPPDDQPITGTFKTESGEIQLDLELNEPIETP